MIPSGILEAIFTAALFGVGWMIRYGFLTINTTLKEISDNLAQAINRLVHLETWKVESEKIAAERHEENKDAIQALKDEINERRRKR